MRGYSRLFRRSSVSFAAPEGEVSRTRQSEKNDADINVIVSRFLKTGTVPTGVKAPQSGDFTNVHDFKGAMNAVVAASEAFDALPSGVRKRFHNDPAEFYDFCTVRDKDGKLANLEEMRKLKLADLPPPEPKPVEPAKVVISNLDELGQMMEQANAEPRRTPRR